MNVSFLDLQKIHKPLEGEIIESIKSVIDSGQYISGEKVTDFEDLFAKWCQASYAIGMGNGLDAITISLKALDIGENDEVIVPATTFIATWLAVSHCGAKIVPVEPSISTYNIDPASIKLAITSRTKAIIMVHLYGQPCNIDEINLIAKENGIALIEDAAQAHGASYKNKRIGSHSDIVTWSFYPGKNLGAIGDGGAVTTNNEELAGRIRELGNYGSLKKYVHDSIGFNSRLDPVQAAILSVKLKYIDSWNNRRLSIASKYLFGIKNPLINLPEMPLYCTSSWHLFVVRSAFRSKLQEHLLKSGIQSIIHYPIPPHLQNAYRQFEFTALPVTEKIHNEVLSLPMGPHLDDSQVDYTIGVINKFDPLEYS
jgi:dTDP-4-amino-4,6-dideoxygalactose transaminase